MKAKGEVRRRGRAASYRVSRGVQGDVAMKEEGRASEASGSPRRKEKTRGGPRDELKQGGREKRSGCLEYGLGQAWSSLERRRHRRPGGRGWAFQQALHSSVGLLVPVGGAEEAILELTDALVGVIEAKGGATGPAAAAAEPGNKGKAEAADAGQRQEEVLREGGPNVKDDLLQGRDGELVLQHVRAVDHLVERLHDGRAADEDVVARHGGVPVSSILPPILSVLLYFCATG